MKRVTIPNLVLVATLALLLPLEQAHCAWMGLQQPAAPAAATSLATGHECCASPVTPAPDPQPRSASKGCACEQLPSATLSVFVTFTTNAPSMISLAVATVPSIIAPVSVSAEIVPALDVGSSPLPDDPGAHGLRAPPVSA